MPGKGFRAAALVLLQSVVIAVLPAQGVRSYQEQKGIEIDPPQGKPFEVETDRGSGAKRLALTMAAVERLEIRTVPVIERVPARGGTPRKVIPYSAAVYDAQGETWVYTSPEPLVFVRERITIEYFEDDLAVLTSGPAPGTAVVARGSGILFGAERFGK